MKKFISKKGNNLVEYALTIALVGIAMGYSLYALSPDTFRDFFKNVFYGSSSSGSVITLKPLGDVP
ncbi:MAG: hypothetical protein ACD_20C00055G0001 [uncultured bacterium]|nr:MAG: hypothetical protein ACD_20C00055G0001 [uncultured bacterium]